MVNKKEAAMKAWVERASKELGAPPGKIIYTATDLDGLDWLDDLPGEPPYIRGPRATMYAGRPWTIRQYAGFSTAEESNGFYRKLLAGGQKGLSVAFDLPTHRGYDSDAPEAGDDVGMAGVAIDGVEDMKILFDGIPLDRMSVSMTMNGAVLPVLAAFIVAGREQGVADAALSGTIQNDVLKEFMVRNTYIYPPGPSMRIVSDIISYTAANMPKYNSVSISGYHIHEAGGSLVQELAFTLADGLEYVRAAIGRGLDVDDFAPRLSFFFAVGTDFFREAAKLRAARLLWSRLMEKNFSPGNPRSLALRTHCQTSGVSLAAQDPTNNIVRTAYEAMSAVLGGTQSLHTNAFDEALALPSEASARVARNTQLILQHETGVTDVVDPLAGSYYVESLTSDLAQGAEKLIAEIEQMGGMTEAIRTGWPKLQIEKSALQTQARVDRGEDVIVGVNRYRAETETEIDILKVDNKVVREGQIARLEKTRSSRNDARVARALDALRLAAREESGNLLELSIEAMTARASLGEVSFALEEVYTRHQVQPELLSGVYAKANEGDAGFETLRGDIGRFAVEEGKKPHLLVAKLGQDGHDRGARVIASAFADLGFEIEVGPLFDTPEAAARQAVQTGAHAIGVSTLAGAHGSMVPALVSALKDQGGEDIVIVCGGVIPPQDREGLKAHGVAAIYGPGTHVQAAAEDVLALIRASLHRNR